MDRLDRSIARRIALAALGLGLLVEVAFDGPSYGLNVLIVVGAVLSAGWTVRRRGHAFDPLDAWLPVGALVVAALVAVRGDPFLAVLDSAAAGTLAGASLVAMSGIAVTRRTATVIAMLGSLAAINVVGGGFGVALASRPFLTGGRVRVRGERMSAILRGLTVGVPLAAIFAVLFASADPMFRRLVIDLLGFDIDLGDLPGRLVVVLASAWLAAGALAVAAGSLSDAETSAGSGAAGQDPASGPGWDVAASRPGPAAGSGAAAPGAAGRRPDPASRSGAATPRAAAGSSFRIGVPEALIVLCAVDLVVGLFVVVQFAYLFGSPHAPAVGMTYADYARRGFFELVAATILSASIVVVIESAIVRRPAAYLVALLGLVGLTAIVLVSAAVRLRLYQEAYGWTELRVYVIATIVMLGAGLVSMTGLILAGRSRWLPHGFAVLGIAALLALNLIAPASFVAERNLERVIDPTLVPADGHAGLDHDYLAVLPDDAVPAMVAALPRLPADVRTPVLAILRERSVELANDPSVRGLFAWNLGRERAREALATLPGP